MSAFFGPALKPQNNLSDVLSPQTSVNNLGSFKVYAYNYGYRANASILSDAANAAALVAAIAALPFGGEIILPNNTAYITAAAITVPDGIVIRSEGDSYSCAMICTGATGNIFNVSGSAVQFDGFKITSNVTRTAGVYAYCTNNTVLFRNMHFVNQYIAVHLDGSTSPPTQVHAIFDKVLVGDGSATAGGAAFIVNNWGDAHFDHCTIAGSSTGANQQDSGLKVTGCETLILNGCNFTQTGRALDVAASTGKDSTAIYATDCQFDRNYKTDHSAYLRTSGTGLIGAATFNGCWFGGALGRGLLVDASGGAVNSIKGLSFIGCIFAANGSHGANFAQVTRFTFVGNQSTGNTGSGVLFNACTYFVCEGNILGTGQYGANGGWAINLVNANDNYVVANNDLTGATSGVVATDGGDNPTTTRFWDNNLGYITKNSGSVSTTTDASGDVTVTHSMSITPAQVLATVTGTTPYFVTAHTIGATQFKIRFYNLIAGVASALGAGVAVTVDWQALG